MKNMFMCLSMVISFFMSSLATAQFYEKSCDTVTKYYPVFMACVAGSNSRPIFYSIEISTQMSPFDCGPVYYSRDAAITVTDLRGAILNSFIIKQPMYNYEIKTAGSYFMSMSYGINLFNCLVDKGDGKGGFSVGN